MSKQLFNALVWSIVIARLSYAFTRAVTPYILVGIQYLCIAMVWGGIKMYRYGKAVRLWLVQFEYSGQFLQPKKINVKADYSLLGIRELRVIARGKVTGFMGLKKLELISALENL